MASTFLQRTAELRNSGINAVEAARKARQEINNANTPSNVISYSHTPTVEPTGTLGPASVTDSTGTYSPGDVGGVQLTNNPVQLDTTNKSSIPTVTTTSAPTITPTTSTNTQGNSSTVTGGGYGTGGTSTVNSTNKNGQIEGKTNQVLGDVMNNYDTNKVADKTQLDETKLAVEANSLALDVELKRKQLEDIDLAKEEDKIQKQKAADDQANLEALQAKEREQNAAAVASLQAKNDAAERDMAIQNDIALQSSTAAMGRLGLTLSTAGIATAQKIHTDGLYNLAKLKTEDAYNMSKLQVEVAKVEFDHTTAINKIVNDSSKRSYDIRKTLNDDIHKINNSIIDNRLSRVEKINAAVDNYQKAAEDNEANTLKLVQSAATTLDDITKSMYETLKVKESYSQDKINIYATSGKWFSMTPAKRREVQKAAGLPEGTIFAQIKANVGKGVVTKLEGVASLTAGKINGIIDEAMKLMDTGGYGMDAAIAVALTNSPEYQTQLKLAEAKKNKVTGSGTGAAKETKWTTTTTVSDDKTQIMQTNPSGEIRWAPVPSSVGTVTNVSGKPKELSFIEQARAAAAAKLNTPTPPVKK